MAFLTTLLSFRLCSNASSVICFRSGRSGEIMDRNMYKKRTSVNVQKIEHFSWANREGLRFKLIFRKSMIRFAIFCEVNSILRHLKQKLNELNEENFIS